MDHHYLQCDPTVALHALLAHIQVCMPGRIAIASFIGATRVCYRVHSYAIAISWSTACMHGQIRSENANIGVFKTIYIRIWTSPLVKYMH